MTESTAATVLRAKHLTGLRPSAPGKLSVPRRYVANHGAVAADARPTSGPARPALDPTRERFQMARMSEADFLASLLK